MNGFEALLAGRTLGERYRIDAVIGRGGMGAVYRATDERLSRLVAVKVIAAVPSDAAALASLRARFHREARAAAGIRHPNVVDVFDFGTDDALGLDYLVMELLRGEDLARRLARAGAPPPETALSILQQAARGLAAGHRAGLVHRDVKPGNLYLEPGETPGSVEVRVLDFGIVEIPADEESTRTQLTSWGSTPHSPAYASPEQLRGEARLSPASDVFSLGAVGYHLLTGERAFQSSDPGRMAGELSVSLASLYARSPQLSPPIRAAVARALSIDPAARFPDAGGFAEALSAASAGWRPAPGRQSALTPRPEPVPVPHGSADATEWAAPAVGSAAPRVATGAPWPGSHPGPVPLPGMRAPEIAVQRRRGFGHFIRGVWEFCVTGTAVGLGAAMWALAITGLMDQNLWGFYGGAIGSVVLTPLAILRLTRRTWRYPLALVASIAVTIGAASLIGLDGDPRQLLGAVLGSQLLVSAALGGIGRRPDPDPRHAG